MNTMTIPEIFSEIDKIVDKFNSDINELKSKLVKQSEPIQLIKPLKPSKMVQMDLFDQPTALGIRPKLGDTGYELKYNPMRQKNGQKGGLKSAGVSRAHAPDRRGRGEAGISSMSVNQKREYWRWVKARRNARKNNAPIPSWDTWKACVSAK